MKLCCSGGTDTLWTFPRTVLLGGITLLLWLLTFAAFFVIMRAFGIPMSIAETVLGSTAAVVAGFLPIGAIGSFGPLEAGWAGGFMLVGLEHDPALASGIGVSLTTLGYAIVLGVVAWLGLWLIGRRAGAARRMENRSTRVGLAE